MTGRELSTWSAGVRVAGQARGRVITRGAVIEGLAES